MTYNVFSGTLNPTHSHSLVSFQQQEVHSVRTIGVLADVQRGESFLVAYAKHVYAYRFLHLFEFRDIAHVEWKSQSVGIKRILYMR